MIISHVWTTSLLWYGDLYHDVAAVRSGITRQVQSLPGPGRRAGPMAPIARR